LMANGLRAPNGNYNAYKARWKKKFYFMVIIFIRVMHSNPVFISQWTENCII